MSAACSFRHGSSSIDGNSLIDSPPVYDDAGHEIVTWTTDTAADFAKATLVDVGIDPWGSLTPAGYFYGNLLFVGLDNMALWQQGSNNLSFDATASVTPTGMATWNTTAIAGGTDLSTLGITHQTFSAWLVGEIYLQQGDNQLALAGADVAFLDLAPPHSATFSRVVTSNGGNTATAHFNATATGWYPIHIGWANSTFNFSLSLQHAPPGSGTFTTFKRSELRGRAEGPRGLMQNVFNHQLLTSALQPATHVLATDALASLQTPLYGQPGGANTWSARFAGQFYAMATGTYTLQVDSEDGNRIAIAGQGSGSNYVANATGASRSIVMPALAPGWHDVVLDLTETGNDAASLALAVTAAPEPALVGQPLPLERLRSVEPPGDRAVMTATTAQQTLPDQGNVTVNLPQMTALGGETVTGVIVRVNLVNPEYTGIGIVLKNPHGDTLTLDTTNAIIQNGSASYYYELTAASAGAATLIANATVGGQWAVIVSDSTPTGGPNPNGRVTEADITLHTSGGPQPLATDAVWTSNVVDNTFAVTSVDDVSWVERATVMPAKVRLRGCDAPCASEAWVDATNGAPLPGAAGHRYLQAQVELFSDGITDSEFQRLVITYRRNRM